MTMNLTVTNTGSAPVDVGGVPLAPGVSTFVSGSNGVAVYGCKPSVKEQIGEALEVIGDAVQGEAPDVPPTVQCNVVNNGSKSVRAILGDGVTDQTLSPGATADLSAIGYIEFRELGNAPQQGGTPD